MEETRTRSWRTLRWTLFGVWLVAALVAMVFALAPALSALGLPPDRVNFGPAMVTGAPWTLPLPFLQLDSVTNLAIIFVAHLLNIPLGLMLARGDD
ncbi:hypothetical protein GCM10009422_13280 [Brevundimonas kwangchunensis]|uniref:Uncharacterized protein n=1 Tax=Brevundimonas kwangchunensis TaxID=322163 RepID=A0ABN1GTL4_9CAUL